MMVLMGQYNYMSFSARANEIEWVSQSGDEPDIVIVIVQSSGLLLAESGHNPELAISSTQNG